MNQSNFNNAGRKQGEEAPYFDRCLIKKFDETTYKSVISILTKLTVPLPDEVDTFMPVATGVLLFLEPYGMVIRIEPKNIERFNDSPWVLQPLLTLEAGDALVEVCPACPPATDMKQVTRLKRELKKENLDYKDSQLVNTGLLPYKTPSFPNGIPVVIDRLAVERLHGKTAFIQSLLSTLSFPKNNGQSIDPQEQLYAPLKKNIQDAWQNIQDNADPKKMVSFWQSCKENVTAGILVAGWNQPLKEIKNQHQGKKEWAAIIGKTYAQKIAP